MLNFFKETEGIYVSVFFAAGINSGYVFGTCCRYGENTHGADLCGGHQPTAERHFT